jgi:hypothetical protein
MFHVKHFGAAPVMFHVKHFSDQARQGLQITAKKMFFNTNSLKNLTLVISRLLNEYI